MLLNKNDYLEYKDFNNNLVAISKAIDSIYDSNIFLNTCNIVASEILAYNNIDNDSDYIYTQYHEIATRSLLTLLLDKNFGAFKKDTFEFLNDADLELCSEYVTNKCIAIAKQYIKTH